MHVKVLINFFQFETEVSWSETAVLGTEQINEFVFVGLKQHESPADKLYSLTANNLFVRQWVVMSYSEGGFVLRQILASSIVLGPLLLLIGIFFYLYKQDRKTVVFYLVAGVALTLVGAACLYTEFKEDDRLPQVEEQASK